ncbi:MULTISPECIES: hypothetical protein [unclassified Bartonella]|uniref:hypothetical protein n=1 Tax=unclassified Bartonella TaxID=2645622 RepID=UPI0035CF6473
MKKLYTIQLSRFSFVQILSLVVAATFVSNITSVFSANPDFRNTFVEGLNAVSEGEGFILIYWFLKCAN